MRVEDVPPLTPERGHLAQRLHPHEIERFALVVTAQDRLRRDNQRRFNLSCHSNDDVPAVPCPVIANRIHRPLPQLCRPRHAVDEVRR